MLTIALVVACSPRAQSGPTPTPESTAAHEPQPPPATLQPHDGAAAEALVAVTVVVARILEQGPLGHGDCTQRSYRVEIVETTRGETLPSPSWIHFERCGGGSPTFDASGLDVGETVQLDLVRGASENFGNEPMIVGGVRETQ
jgi:hypothetical protein